MRNNRKGYLEELEKKVAGRNQSDKGSDHVAGYVHRITWHPFWLDPGLANYRRGINSKKRQNKMIWFIILQTAGRIGSPVLGIIIPATILLISFILTWLLYRHFSRQK